MESNINDLMIIDPPEKNFEFIMGESRILKYQIHNTGEFPIKDFNVRANTILKTPEGDSIPTQHSYVEVLKYPKILQPGQKGVIEIRAEVPFDYKEVIKRDGKTVNWPYRIALTIKSIKHIQEI